MPPPLSEGRFDHQPLSRETRSRHSSHHTLEVQVDLNMVRSIAHLNLYSYTPTLTHVANTYIHPSIHNPPRLLWGAWTQTCLQAPSKCPHSCSLSLCSTRTLCGTGTHIWGHPRPSMAKRPTHLTVSAKNSISIYPLLLPIPCLVPVYFSPHCLLHFCQSLWCLQP